MVVLGAVIADRADSAAALLPGRARAVPDRVLHGISEAALPLALENMERFGVPKHIVGVRVPTGYSFNLDGTTLYLSLASVFVAQAAGVHMTLGAAARDDADPDADQQRRGRRAARRAGDSGRHAEAFHLPMEGFAVLLGVDAVMDMARTSVNVLGNCLASAVVARWEGFKVG